MWLRSESISNHPDETKPMPFSPDRGEKKIDPNSMPVAKRPLTS
jgi:hypothetical protein